MSRLDLSLSEAQEYTRRLASTHYENFPVLSRFVPRDLRQHVANVYAYCRWSDDLADEIGDPRQSLEALDAWEAELRRAYESEATHPILLALAETIRCFEIPIEPFRDLLIAFRRDQIQTRYPSFVELRDYCRYSADPVGRLVLYLCRRHSPELVALSDSICTGLQLVNFLQDVGVDAERGRIYLPMEELGRFGVAEAAILAKSFGPNFARLAEFQADRAEDFLTAGLPIVARLPGRWKWVVGLFAHGGLEVVRKIRKVGYNVFDARPTLSKWCLPRLVFRATLSAARRAPRGRRSRVPRELDDSDA